MSEIYSVIIIILKWLTGIVNISYKFIIFMAIIIIVFIVVVVIVFGIVFTMHDYRYDQAG